jgi:hypothetical protein
MPALRPLSKDQQISSLVTQGLNRVLASRAPSRIKRANNAAQQSACDGKSDVITFQRNLYSIPMR